MAAGGEEIVVIDDDDEVRAAVLAGLRRASPRTVAGFDTGEAGLAYALAHPVAVVVSDIDMLPMSGLEMAKRLRAARPDIAIVFLTGFPDPVPHVEDVRPQAVLAKPVTLAELVAAIRAVLPRREGE